ncbi:RHS repeat-associated core domain-containing protein [Affinibrenneria salicis]|uniref:RHS repeat-associated core domain-containing protein n=1 Tax=Affinibrenneria salicis TaxID=2590031 RepID=UPI0037C04344
MRRRGAACCSVWGETEYKSRPGRLNGRRNLRFQGQWLERETVLHYNLYRYYDPQCGRFTQAKPIGLASELNQYVYVPNLLSWIAPLGLAGCNINRAVKDAQSGKDVTVSSFKEADQIIIWCTF